MTLAVENMDCAACPYIVREAMAAVPGVGRVEVSLERKAAVVTFDDARTTVEAVAAASADAGFPARRADAGRPRCGTRICYAPASSAVRS